MLGINNSVPDFVTKFFGECLDNDRKCPPLIMGLQILHIFEHERGRSLIANDARYIKKQSALRFTGESMATAE